MLHCYIFSKASRKLENVNTQLSQLSLCKHTLLSDTQTLVGNRLSEPVAMAARVRQGCPLAPLLYLFVAQALLSWPTRCGVGIPG